LRTDNNPETGQGVLRGLRIDQVREAIRANRVSFPNQVPTFERNFDRDLEEKLVRLYFVLDWNCENVAAGYGLSYKRVRQILTKWKRRAAAAGYIRSIPAANSVHPDRDPCLAGGLAHAHDHAHVAGGEEARGDL
jgi:hypothetical protein